MRTRTDPFGEKQLARQKSCAEIGRFLEERKRPAELKKISAAGLCVLLMKSADQAAGKFFVEPLAEGGELFFAAEEVAHHCAARL